MFSRVKGGNFIIKKRRRLLILFAAGWIALEGCAGEIRKVAKSCRRDTPVIGSDSRICFSVWEIIGAAVQELSEGEGLADVMAKMDTRVTNSSF